MTTRRSQQQLLLGYKVCASTSALLCLTVNQYKSRPESISTAVAAATPRAGCADARLPCPSPDYGQRIKPCFRSKGTNNLLSQSSPQCCRTLQLRVSDLQWDHHKGGGQRARGSGRGAVCYERGVAGDLHLCGRCQWIPAKWGLCAKASAATTGIHTQPQTGGREEVTSLVTITILAGNMLVSLVDMQIYS